MPEFLNDEIVTLSASESERPNPQPVPRPRLSRAKKARMIDTKFRLEQTPEEIQQFLRSQAVVGYRKLVDASILPERLIRYVRTQIPNIHNDIDPETEPLPNPDNPRPNPTSGTTEPKISAPEDLAA